MLGMLLCLFNFYFEYTPKGIYNSQYNKMVITNYKNYNGYIKYTYRIKNNNGYVGKKYHFIDNMGKFDIGDTITFNKK